MRAIIVAGGRSFKDYEGMKTTLNGLIDRKDENDTIVLDEKDEHKIENNTIVIE